MTFARYTERTLFERPLTSWVAYAVKVPHSEREEFERKQGWSIKKMVKDEEHPTRGNDSSFEDEPSPIKEEYAPVIFAQDTIKHVISVDLLTGKVCLWMDTGFCFALFSSCICFVFDRKIGIIYYELGNREKEFSPLLLIYSNQTVLELS